MPSGRNSSSRRMSGEPCSRPRARPGLRAVSPTPTSRPYSLCWTPARRFASRSSPSRTSRVEEEGAAPELVLDEDRGERLDLRQLLHGFLAVEAQGLGAPTGSQGEPLQLEEVVAERSLDPREPGEGGFLLAVQSAVHEPRAIGGVAGGGEKGQTVGPRHFRHRLPQLRAGPEGIALDREAQVDDPQAGRRLAYLGQRVAQTGRAGPRSPRSGRRARGPGSQDRAASAQPSAAGRARASGPGHPARCAPRAAPRGTPRRFRAASSSYRGRELAGRGLRRVLAHPRGVGRVRRPWIFARSAREAGVEVGQGGRQLAHLLDRSHAPGRGGAAGPRSAARRSGSRSSRGRRAWREELRAPPPARPRPGSRPGRTGRGGRSSRGPTRRGTSRRGAGRSLRGSPPPRPRPRCVEAGEHVGHEVALCRAGPWSWALHSPCC